MARYAALFTLQSHSLGVCNSEIGTFDKSFVMDVAAHPKEEIDV